MQIKSAIKIISIFLVVLILLLAILLLATNRSKDGGDDTQDSTSSAEETTSEETTADASDTDPDETDEPTGTTGSSDTTPPADTSGPADTTKPDVPTVPTDYVFKKTLKTDNGTALALRADCYGVKDGDKIKVTVSLYLEHRSIEMRDKNGCRLSLGDVSKTFSIDGITVEDNKLHSQLICSVERVCDYGETVEVYARMPFRGTYAEVEIEFLEIDSSITLN